MATGSLLAAINSVSQKERMEKCTAEVDTMVANASDVGALVKRVCDLPGWVLPSLTSPGVGLRDAQAALALMNATQVALHVVHGRAQEVGRIECAYHARTAAFLVGFMRREAAAHFAQTADAHID